jgi:hypothetical protein
MNMPNKITIFSLFLLSSCIGFADDLDSLFDNTNTYTSDFDYMQTDSSYLSDHFYGQVAIYSALAEKREKHTQVLRLSYSESLSQYDLFIEGEAFSNRRYRKFEIHDNTNQVYRKITIETESTESDINLREAYIRGNYKYGSITVGKQILVWGSMNLLSPIDFLLPYKLDSRGTGVTKASNRYPLNMITATLYPKPNITLSAHYILESPVSSLIEPYTNDDYDFPVAGDSDYTNRNRVEFEKQNRNQFALRALYSPNWGSIGLTYFDGINNFTSPTAKGSIKKISPINPSALGYEITVDEFKQSRMQAVGIESTVKVSNSLFFKSELVQARYQESVQFDSSNYDDPLGEFLVNNNNSQLQYDSGVNIVSIGLESQPNWGVFEINIASVIPIDPDQQDKLDELQSIERDDGNIAPSLHIARYFFEENRGQLGLYAGMTPGLRFGAALYYTHLFNDAWRMYVSLDHTQNFDDQLDAPEDVDSTNLMEPSSGASLGVSYSF